jgi:hypothetical protein
LIVGMLFSIPVANMKLAIAQSPRVGALFPVDAGFRRGQR